MSFKKIAEEAPLCNDLEHKSAEELSQDINAEDQKAVLAIQKTIPRIVELVGLIIPRMKQGGCIFYTGAGTNGRLGMLNTSELSPTFGASKTLVIGLTAGGDTALCNVVEMAEGDEEHGWNELTEYNINSNDAVVGIAALGTTPYIAGTLRNMREHGILIAYITNNPDSPVAVKSDIAIEMIVGPEYVTSSSHTKSGTE